MANFIMTNWYIKDKTPYVVIGIAGENNATSISIECDEIIENAEYFLDIGDTKNDIFNTQELTVKQQTTPTGEMTNILYLKPMRSFLGKEGVKLLQVRCEYIDNDEKVTKESNVFHAVVNKNTGFTYKFDIAIFQQYLNKVKELAAKVAQDIANLTLGELKDTNIVNPTDGQVIKYDAETQKWVNGEGGGGSSLQNVADAVVSGKSGGVLLNDIANNIASGDYATAEGCETIASGTASHAEGISAEDGIDYVYTTASGYASHAEGIATIAQNMGSHAEGSFATASGKASHAEGMSTISSGEASHSQNYWTIAQGQYQTAIGKCNIAQGTNNSTTSIDYAFIIGNGSDEDNRSNALAIKWDGTFVFADGTEISPAQFAQLKALLN